MTDDFDDDALRHAIGSRSGGPVHTGTARHDVITRAQRTRTLRTGAVFGATSLVLVAGLLVLTSPGDAPIEPADQPAAPTVDTVETVTTIAARPTTTSPATDTATTSPATSDPATTAAPEALPPAEPAPPSTPSPTDAPAPTTSPSTTTAPAIAPTTSPSTTAEPTPNDPPFTQQYNSTGGSITVNWNGSALSLVSTAPNSGFEAEIEDQAADRIRVRFRSDNDDARIDVRARDGQVEHTVS